MPLERVLIEYAKVQLQLIVAGERIAQLEAEIAASKEKPVPQETKS
jgi:hypothetical protein